MLALTFNDTPYRIMGLIHVLTVVVAFGPLFMYPSLKRAGQTATIAGLHMRVVFPALVVMWVAGMGLSGLSDGLFELTQAWLALSILVWVVLMVVSWFMIRPALGDTSEAATSKMMAGVGIHHLGLVIGLVLMIWRPGL